MSLTTYDQPAPEFAQTAPAALSPAASPRIRLLDVLRGFAILGTLGTNIWIFAYLGDLNYLFTFTNSAWWDSPETLVRLVFLALVNGKFLGLLAMMFGAGLEMKYRQALRKERPWPGMYLWTAGLLMLEGFLHYMLVMEFDILMGYAAAAVIVAYLVRAGERAMRRALYWIGGVHLAVVVLIGAALGFAAVSGASFSMGDMGSVVSLYSQGTWWEQVVYRLTHLPELRLEVVFALPLNVCLFLGGVLLMRAGAFSSGDAGRRLRGRMLRIGMVLGLPLNLLVFVPGGVFDIPMRYLFAPLLSIGYLAAIGHLLERYAHARIWTHLENAGRMSLSCYVGQNLFCAWLFYGWGLGLGGTLDAFQVLGIWMGLSLLQLFMATLWLRYFRYGPMESARRTLSPKS